MKNIDKLNSILRLGLSLVFFMAAFISSAQKVSLEMPSLDDKKDIYNLKFTEDPENPKILSAYMEGETEPDSLRFKAEISKVMERVMVTVITEKPNHEIKVDIVKNNWTDVKRSGKTKNGSFQISFDTADQFGIVISSSESNIPFHMAVWTSGKIIPESSLFYSVDGEFNGISNTTLTSNVSSDSPQNNRSDMLLYAIIGLLLFIVVLLLVIFLRKKSNKITLFLIILISSHALVFGKARPSNSSGFMAAAFKQSNAYVDLIFKIDDFASALNALQKGFETFSNFLDDLENQEAIDMDPAGQPRLPSSCLSSYSSNNPNGNNSTSNSDDDNWSENDSPNTNDESNDGSKNQVDFQPMEAAGGIFNEKSDNGPGESQNAGNSKPLRLPQYDSHGKLKNPGDFPNAPLKIDPSNSSPPENPFIESGNDNAIKLIQPEYDRNGLLKDPGDYPNAPLRIDPETGIPIMNPFVDGSESTSFHVRQPKYSKDGILIDPGDFPDAPLRIDPSALNNKDNPSTNVGLEQSQNNIKTKGTGNIQIGSGNGDPSGTTSMSSNNPNSSIAGNGSGSVGGPRNNGDSESPGSGSLGGPRDKDDPNKRAGCKCLQNAYKKLEETRLRLETLRVITDRLDRNTNYYINWGDDVSSVHGVVGIVWQEKKVEILKAMKKFDGTYDAKYHEMIPDLYKNLIEIDRCEALLGFENWYSNAGFIYYEFMREKYKR
jgi:hypothetical protein